MGGVVHTTLATTRSTGVVDPAQSNPFDDDKMYEPPGRGRVHGRHGVVGLAPSRRAVSHRTAPTLRQTLGWVASTTTTTTTTTRTTTTAAAAATTTVTTTPPLPPPTTAAVNL